MKNERKKQGISVLLLICISITTALAVPVTLPAQPAVSENCTQIHLSVSENGPETKMPEAKIPEANVPETKVLETGEPAPEPEAAKQEISANSVQPETLSAVSELLAVSASYRTIKVSYKAVYGAEGYEVYRGTSAKNMKLIADLSPLRTSYTDKGDDKKYLQTNKRYYYKVRAYRLDDKKQKIYGGFSAVVSAKPVLDDPVLIMTKTVNYKSVKLTYGRVKGANGYVIYRSEKKDSGFRRIATVKKGKIVEYTDKTCKTGTKYYYRIRAYRTIDGKKKYSAYSGVITAKTKLNTPKMKGITVVSPDTALLTWRRVSGASGYAIYRSETKDGKYRRVAWAKGGKTVQAYVGGQENGKTYYYKVRAYRTVDKKKKYSAYSVILGAMFNQLASGDETYQGKAQRIFGLNYYKKYASKEEAERNMVSITVNVWDFASDGVTKVTKQKTLQVHKNIAETVKQIFKEIYEGEEKFPIKNVGGYSWRGDTSRSEHCCGLAIDINWEENYLIDNGVIISGKLYEPGVNPYSIPTDGEVARIMKKYGFSQGIWGKRCDYMHFSYFGT